jgi:DNA-directed RNA polymerase subunit alpha
METIAKPNKIEFINGAKPNQTTVAVEPFYPGYGMTIGNSVRRVLLSSLLGTAVVGVKIQGASHEFTTLPYIKEDILEIIMNLKNLKLKMFDDEEIKLELDVHGKKEVLASDIKKDSRTEIVNPDLHIANITDMAGSMTLEITVGKGRGYRPVEAIENKNTEVGYIETDAFFSPVQEVGIRVENVRVGKMTNWDKLMIDITTDGTITPEQAFKDSVKILQEQVGALAVEEVKEEPAIVEEEENEEAGAEEEVKDEDKKAKKEKKVKKEKKK